LHQSHIKVHGEWRYLYRAIDRSGALVDVMFSEHRDMAAESDATGPSGQGLRLAGISSIAAGNAFLPDFKPPSSTRRLRRRPKAMLDRGCVQRRRKSGPG
jgi:hypothetical protein